MAVKSIKKGIKNKGLSLIHMVYPCPTNFGSRELGTRNAVTMNNWIKDQAAPMGKEKENTVWSTGIYHDASNSRPEFQEVINKSTEKIRRVLFFSLTSSILWFEEQCLQVFTSI